MPEGAVYVGRPSQWGNPYLIGAPHPVHEWPISREEAVDLYRKMWEDDGTPAAEGARDHVRSELRGKDLVCWCPVGLPCHADVLLEIANG
jgi:hypothetical protein